MKRLFFMVLALMLGFTTAFSQHTTKVNEELSFKFTTFDFGVIKEEDGVKSASFPLENIGNTPLIISRIDASCGCTTVSYLREPIMSKEKSTITISYDPEFRPGFFEKRIYVYTNSNTRCNVLTIKGEVTPRPKGISDMYPFNVTDKVLSSSSSIDFGYIPVGYSHSLSLDIYNNSDKTVRLEAPRVAEGGDYSYYITTPKLAAKSRGQIIVTFDLRSSVKFSIYDFLIPLYIDGLRSDGGAIRVSAISTPDGSKYKSDGSGTPSVFLPETYFRFNSIAVGESYMKSFEVENEGDKELKIVQVIVSDDELIDYSISSRVVKPHTKETIKIILSPKVKKGRVNERVIIITDDPAFPVSEIRIAANIIEHKI